VPLPSLTLALALLLQAPSVPQVHDNVIVILADDMGIERTPAYGTEVVPSGPTPWLDALARYGVLFRNAYAEPLCSPTRSAILTGKHPFRTGIGRGVGYNGGAGNLEGDPAENSLADALSATHRTAAIGKWHLSINEDLGGTGYQHPILYGFDEHRGPIANLKPNDPNGYFNYVKNIADASGNQQAQMSDAYATSDQVDDALSIIESAGEEPWFVWLAFNAPHTPFHIPPTDLTTLHVESSSSNSTKHRAAIQAMDTEIGRLLQSLRPAVLQRTWIIFLGDNGSPDSALPGISDAKGTAHEYGVHVPLIIVGPRVFGAGREVDALVGVTDLYATVCDMVRVSTPTSALDSVSFYEHLLDPHAIPRRTTVYSETFQPNGPPPYIFHDRTVRDARFKLRDKNPAILSQYSFYRLATDPFGEQDLLPALTRAQTAVFNSLVSELDALTP